MRSSLPSSATADNDDVRPLSSAVSSASSSSLLQILSGPPMRLVRVWTPRFGMEAQDVPPWLVLVALIVFVVLVLSGAWVWA